MHFTITGGTKLRGSVSVNGAKNSALAIISAAALAQDGATYLENVPLYTDILDLCEILRALGAEAAHAAVHLEAAALEDLKLAGRFLGPG